MQNVLQVLEATTSSKQPCLPVLQPLPHPLQPRHVLNLSGHCLQI